MPTKAHPFPRAEPEGSSFHCDSFLRIYLEPPLWSEGVGILAEAGAIVVYDRVVAENQSYSGDPLPGHSGAAAGDDALE